MTRPRRVIGVLGAAVLLLAAATAGAVVTRGPYPQPDTTGGLPPPIPLTQSGVAEVWAVGDGPDGGRDAREVAELIAAANPALVLYLGDVYSGDYSTFPDAYGQLAARTAPTPGNHDWPRNAEYGYLPYWRGVHGRPLASYYPLHLAGWQVLSLNSEAPYDAESEQVRWVRSQVRTPGTCRLAFWHRPHYSAGKHGDEHVRPLWDALRGRAALVVNGHDHNMQRLKPVEGLTQLVSGAGGRSHHGVDRRDERVSFADDRHYGALRLRLSPGRADLAFVAVGGRVLDASTVTCVSAPGSRSTTATARAAAHPTGAAPHSRRRRPPPPANR